MMSRIFSCMYQPFVCLLWINVYSSPLPILESYCLGIFVDELQEFPVYSGY